MPTQTLNEGEKESRYAESDDKVFYLRDVHRLVATEKRMKRLVLSGEIISSAEELHKILTKRLSMQSTNVRKAFRKLDSDYSGQLDRDEFKRFLECLNIHTTVSVFNEVFDSLDHDGGGTVGFNEFMNEFGKAIAGESMPIMFLGGAHAKEKFEKSVRDAETRAGVKSFTADQAIHMLQDKLATMSSSCRRIFHHANTDVREAHSTEEGGLSKNEFRQLIDKFNIRMDSCEFDKLYSMLDPDGSGVVSYQEFVHAFGASIAGAKTENNVRWGATAVPKHHDTAKKFAELAEHAERHVSGPQVQRGGSLQEDHMLEKGGHLVQKDGDHINDETSEFAKKTGPTLGASLTKKKPLGPVLVPSSPIRSTRASPPPPNRQSLLKQSKAALVLQYRKERQAKRDADLAARTAPPSVFFKKSFGVAATRRLATSKGSGGMGVGSSSRGPNLFGEPAIQEDEMGCDAREDHLADELVSFPMDVGGGGGGEGGRGTKLRPLNLAPLAAPPDGTGGASLGAKGPPLLRPATPLPGTSRPLSRAGRPMTSGGGRSDQGFKGNDLIRATPRAGGPEESAQRLRDRLVVTEKSLASPMSTGLFTVTATRPSTAGAYGSRPVSRSGRY